MKLRWGRFFGGVVCLGALFLSVGGTFERECQASSRPRGSAPSVEKQGPFPKGPDLELTPGSLCERPSTKRYAEGIPYCTRDVDSDLKRQVMENYDRQLGFRVNQMDRGDFKIDHFIPLCMGGSNQADNLWPQHVSVYNVTDRLEQVSCEKMAKGKLLQAEAVAGIREAKLNLSRTSAILARVESL